MDQYFGGAIALVALLTTLMSGVSVASALETQATLATITTQAAADMAVDGGYTQAVQSAIKDALSASGLTAAGASVSVMVNNNPPSNTAWYGDTYTIWLTYPLAVPWLGGAVFDITTSAPGVSTLPCTQAQTQTFPPNCTAPASSAGGGV